MNIEYSFRPQMLPICARAFYYILGAVEMEVLPYFYLNKKGNKLLKGNQNVELPEEYSKVGLPAHKAAFSGDVEALPLIVFALADEGVPLEDAYGASPLHLAARKNDVKVAK